MSNPPPSSTTSTDTQSPWGWPPDQRVHVVALSRPLLALAVIAFATQATLLWLVLDKLDLIARLLAHREGG